MSDQALVVGGSAKFGKLLLEEAERVNNERRKQILVNGLSGVLSQIEVGKDAVGKMNASIASLEARVAALKAGHFDVTREGQIVYKKPDLNESVQWISECRQCGYQKVVIAKV